MGLHAWRDYSGSRDTYIVSQGLHAWWACWGLQESPTGHEWKLQPYLGLKIERTTSLLVVDLEEMFIVLQEISWWADNLYCCCKHKHALQAHTQTFRYHTLALQAHTLTPPQERKEHLTGGCIQCELYLGHHIQICAYKAVCAQEL